VLHKNDKTGGREAHCNGEGGARWFTKERRRVGTIWRSQNSRKDTRRKYRKNREQAYERRVMSKLHQGETEESGKGNV